MPEIHAVSSCLESNVAVTDNHRYGSILCFASQNRMESSPQFSARLLCSHISLAIPIRFFDHHVNFLRRAVEMASFLGKGPIRFSLSFSCDVSQHLCLTSTSFLCKRQAKKYVVFPKNSNNKLFLFLQSSTSRAQRQRI